MYALAAALLLAFCLMSTANAHRSESCDISVNSVPFGAYDPGDPLVRDGVGAIIVSCSVEAGGRVPAWAIALDAGPYGSFASRVMMSGNHRMRYNLYTDASRTTIWGDGTAGTARMGDGECAAAGRTVRRLPLYGRIPALQDLPAGAYTDVITVTVEY